MTDSRDNKVYKIVKIGNQVWMAENLNYADSVKTPSLMGKNWCYANKAENCAVTGRLYTWAAAIDSVALYDGGNGVDCGSGKTCTLPTTVQGICPSGWHLPMQTECISLYTTAGGQQIVGGGSTAFKILKSQTGWYESGYGTDVFGFSALPAGYRNNDGDFYYGGSSAFFWCASESGRGGADFMDWFFLTFEGAGLYGGNKGYGFSVRCLKD